MADWRPGDKAVWIGGHSNQKLTAQIEQRMGHYKGQVLTVEAVFHDGRICREHGAVSTLLFVGHRPRSPRSACCHHAVRKPLDFKKLCNVDESTKIKEDA